MHISQTPKPPGTLFGHNSLLTKVDLSSFLSNEDVWNGLTGEQKTILKSMCPPDCTWGKGSSEQPSLGLLLYDMHWKSDVRVFQENLKDGYYEPEWIEEAKEATTNREDGKFDDWKRRNFEEYWDQKMVDKKDLIVNKQKVMLMDLLMGQELQLGDELVYSRSFGRGKRITAVEYKFEISGVDDYGKVEFRIILPSGATTPRKRSRSETVADKEEDTLQSKKMKQDDLLADDTFKETIQSDSTASIQPDIKSSPVEQIPTILPQRRSARNRTLTKAQDNKLIKSILEKPKLAITSITTGEVDDFQKQLLEADGRSLKSGTTDSWKYFAVRRSGQDIGSLYDIRKRFWENQE